MSGTNWYTFVNDTGAKTKIVNATEVNSNFDWAEGHLCPHNSGVKTGSTYKLGHDGTNVYPFHSLYLDNGATDGGAIYFDSGTATKFFKCNAAGTEINSDIIISALALHTTTLLTDHIGEHTPSHCLVFDNVVLVTSDANTTDFPRASLVSSKGNSTLTLSSYVGVVGEALADGTYTAYGVYGFATGSTANSACGVAGYAVPTAVNGQVCYGGWFNSKTSSLSYGVGVYGSAGVSASTNTNIAYGGYFVSSDTHTGANNVAVYAYAANASSSGVNYSWYSDAGIFYNSGDVQVGAILKVDHIEEKNAAHGVVLDGVTLKDGLISSPETSGTWTPSLTNTTNVAASTPETCWWIRSGNNVMVGGTLWIDPTTAATDSLIKMSLPIASNFASTYDAGGTMAAVGSASGVGCIDANAADDLLNLSFLPNLNSNSLWGFSAMYTVK